MTFGASLLSSVTVLFLLGFLIAGRWLLSETTAGLAPEFALTWLVVALGYAGLSVRLLLGRLPIKQLTPIGIREQRMARIETIRRRLLIAALVAPLVIGGVWTAATAGVFDAMPGVARALDALAAPWLLGALVIVGTAAWSIALVAILLRAATRRFGTSTARKHAAAAAGVALTVAFVFASLGAIALPSISNINVALAMFSSITAGPIVLLFATVVVLGVASMGLLPDRAGGPALAATGLVIATIGFGRAPTWLVAGLLASAVVVWDVSTYGLGLTAELGHLPETRRLELLHGVVIVGIGLLAVLAVTGLSVLRGSLLGPGSTLATFVVGIGVLVLLVGLRG